MRDLFAAGFRALNPVQIVEEAETPEVLFYNEETDANGNIKPVPGKIYELTDRKRMTPTYDGLFLSGDAISGVWARVNDKDSKNIEVIRMNLYHATIDSRVVFPKSFLKLFAKLK